MFNHEGPVVISAILYLTVRVFEQLDISSTVDVDNMLAYTQRILRGAALKKYREVLVTCRLSCTCPIWRCTKMVRTGIF